MQGGFGAAAQHQLQRFGKQEARDALVIGQRHDLAFFPGELGRAEMAHLAAQVAGQGRVQSDGQMAHAEQIGGDHAQTLQGMVFQQPVQFQQHVRVSRDHRPNPSFRKDNSPSASETYLDRGGFHRVGKRAPGIGKSIFKPPYRDSH